MRHQARHFRNSRYAAYGFITGALTFDEIFIFSLAAHVQHDDASHILPDYCARSADVPHVAIRIQA